LVYLYSKKENIFLGSQETKRTGGTVGGTDSGAVRGSYRPPGFHQP